MSSKIIGPLAACVVLSLSVAGCALRAVAHTPPRPRCPRREGLHPPPPADREETATAAPSAEHFWVRGNWRWEGAEYRWTPGHWEARRANASWKAGHWRNISGGWV